MTAILDAAATGVLTPEEGSRLAQLVEHIRAAIETVELDSRLKSIELRMEAKKLA
jgi:hypothetical protein